MELASFHLIEDAQVWFMKVEEENPTLTWAEFKEESQTRLPHPFREEDLVNSPS